VFSVSFSVEDAPLQPRYTEGRNLNALASNALEWARLQHDTVRIGAHLDRYRRASGEGDGPPVGGVRRRQDVGRWGGVTAHWDRFHVPLAGDVGEVDRSRSGG